MTDRSDPLQLLNRTLRDSASRASEVVPGGVALLFASLPVDGEDEAPRLRAAAGFATLDEARAAATALRRGVATCINDVARRSEPAPEALSSVAAGGVLLVPVAIGERCFGALAVAAPEKPSREVGDALERLAFDAALHIDHQRLQRETTALQKQLSEHAQAASEKGDEILKLSETLFEQDLELLRNSEKVGQIEKIKSDFIEKMSRELRTPLNGIIEAIVSVLAGENESLSDGAKQSLRRALDEGTIYQRTLQNILELWRIKQGELPVEIQELNFAEVVEEAIFSVQDTLADKPIEVVRQLAEPLPRIKGDLTKINQVLFLILDNAAKFTREGTITVSAEVEDGVLRCRVEDTGIGICSDDREFIFDEFFQVDDQKSTQYRGAGLGLSLARELLGLLNGRCTIESEAGRGTVATIEIPAALA